MRGDGSVTCIRVAVQISHSSSSLISAEEEASLAVDDVKQALGHMRFFTGTVRLVSVRRIPGAKRKSS